MWERTVTIGSAGKTFSVTGWKLGWAYGPAALMKNLQTVHQNCIYTCSTPLQEALARGLEHEISLIGTPQCYFTSLAVELRTKRERMVRALTDNGFRPTVPEGGFFIIADWTGLEHKLDLSSEPDRYRDYRFTKRFAKDTSVLSIPPSAFYCQEHKHLGESYARFCFIKKDENLDLAAKLMSDWNKKAK